VQINLNYQFSQEIILINTITLYTLYPNYTNLQHHSKKTRGVLTIWSYQQVL